MSFWKKPKDRPPGQISLKNSLGSRFLLGSPESHLAILGVDGTASVLKPQTKPMAPRSVSSAGSQIHLNPFQPNHHRVVSGHASPSSSLQTMDPAIYSSTSVSPSSSISISSSPEVTKRTKIEALLESPTIDINDLKKLSWGGLPSDLRPLAWKLLLGYLPTAKERRQGTLLRKRSEYFELRKTFFPKAENEKSEQILSNLDEELWHQISIDVPRTNPTLPLFQHPQIRQCLERILYCWSIRHPASGYVQGLNDLATPFLAVFLQEFLPLDNIAENERELDTISNEQLESLEADTFWCFTKLVDGIQDNYTSGQRGIQRQLGLMKYLIGRIDAQLAAHIDRENLLYVQFAFRWMNCLLMREFSFAHTLRLWDAYMSESPHGFSGFHVYVCAALLVKWSTNLQKMEFQDMIMFLQNLPTSSWKSTDIELLLSEAFLWHSLFHDAPSHLS